MNKSLFSKEDIEQWLKNRVVLSKTDIETLAKEKKYLPHDSDYLQLQDLDGTYARRYLESKGFTVITNKDTGRNGIAITTCGLHLSTNGYVHY